MFSLARLSALCALLALASCGPVNENGAAPVTASAQRAQAGSTTTTFNAPVQAIYISYFGRPADPAGLAWFAARFSETGVAPQVGAIASAYNSNPGVRAQIDAFSQSAESTALYPGDNRTFLTAIYSYLFNRAPDSAGLEYWISEIDKGHVTRGGAAIAIMSGSQGSDSTIVGLKIEAATQFTTSLDTEERRKKYDGLGANLVARQLLSSVTTQLALDGFMAKAETALNYMAGTVATDANFNITTKVTRIETAASVVLPTGTMYCEAPGAVGVSETFGARIAFDPVKGTATMDVDGEKFTGTYNFTDGNVSLKVNYPEIDPLGTGVYTAWGSTEFSGVYNVNNGTITGTTVDQIRIKWTRTADQLACTSYGTVSGVKVQ